MSYEVELPGVYAADVVEDAAPGVGANTPTVINLDPALKKLHNYFATLEAALGPPLVG